MIRGGAKGERVRGRGVAIVLWWWRYYGCYDVRAEKDIK